MTWEVLVVFGLLAVAVVLFAWERISYDATAVTILATLMLTGILSPAQALSGFSNAATVTIGAMFVLSEGLRRTGALESVGDFFSRLGEENPWYALGIMMIVIGTISAFINNTAAIAIFIPVVLGVAAQLEVSPSRLLMPVSFASMFGGVCTLIGTSTNILVSSIASDHGEAPFSMFEFAPLGIVFFVVGLAYLFTVGVRIIPERRGQEELTTSFEMSEYLTDIVLKPDSVHVGKTLGDATLTQDLDVDIVQVLDGNQRIAAQDAHAPLEAGDILRVRGSIREINRLLAREDLALKTARDWHDRDLQAGGGTLVEAVVAPDSPLQQQPLAKAAVLKRLGAVVLAVRRHGRVQQEDLGKARLSGGDSLLLSMEDDRLPELEQDPSFVVVSEVGLPRPRRKRMPLAIAILAGVVLTAAVGLLPIVASAVTGCVLLVLTGCLKPEEAYDAINWKIIFLLAGVLPLGIAMEQTGAALVIAHSLIELLGDLGPRAVLSGFFLVSVLLTNVISNQATAALLAPIAIQAAGDIGISSRPLLMAVTYAASLSLMTPIGYQTNTMVYGPGQYKFTDFTRVGTPLDLIFWLIATLLIPVIWPF